MEVTASKRLTIALVMLVVVVMCLFGCGDGKKDESKHEEPTITESETDEPKGRAGEILAAMDVKQKAGQVVLARLPDVNQVEELKQWEFGGYILYEKDFRDADGNPFTETEVSDMTDSYREALKLTPFIAVDEEGGTVVRASSNENLFPEGPAEAPQEIWKQHGEKALYDDAAEKSKRLLACGINLNLAPVADVPTSNDSFMYERSLGADFTKTGELINGIVKAMTDSGIGSVLKHFPGYGDTGDSHGGIQATDKKSVEDFKAKDFIPFKEGIKAGAGGVMMSHVLAKGIDDKRPVSLSEKAHELLRNELGFDGVILTDDIWMISPQEYDIEESLAPLAIKAGNDMIISTDAANDVRDIVSAVANGELDVKLLDEAVSRIIRWKIKLGIVE